MKIYIREKNMETLKPKLFEAMKNYTRQQLIKDIISGIIVAIIALPLSIALAIASGVTPECGLYTAIIAGFFISFFGGSRVQIGGLTAAFVVITYGIVTDFGLDGLIVATILAGIILIIMGICRFGALIKYIPYTITTGFTCGIGVSLFVGQIKDFLGLDMGAVPSEFIEKIAAYAAHITTTDLTTVLIGVLALAILIFFPKLTDKIPASLYLFRSFRRDPCYRRHRPYRRQRKKRRTHTDRRDRAQHYTFAHIINIDAGCCHDPHDYSGSCAHCCRLEYV